MRALAQGLDERASWDRYLRLEGEHTDLRTVRRTIAWIRDAVRGGGAARAEAGHRAADPARSRSLHGGAGAAEPGRVRGRAGPGGLLRGRADRGLRSGLPGGGWREGRAEAKRRVGPAVAPRPRHRPPAAGAALARGPGGAGSAARRQRGGLAATRRWPPGSSAPACRRWSRWSNASTASVPAGGRRCPGSASARRPGSWTGCMPTKRCSACASARTSRSRGRS